MSDYRARAVDRGVVCIEHYAGESFDAAVQAAVTLAPFTRYDVIVVNADGIDYDCADGLTADERETVDVAVTEARR